MPAGSGKAGNICIRNPWPGIMQTIWGDRDRFVEQYYAQVLQEPESKDWRDWPYFAADGAVLAADGYFRILGRVDDVINVAGHRLGTKEIESACLTVAAMAEAAVVPVVDEIKGRVPDIYVSLKPGYTESQGSRTPSRDARDDDRQDRPAQGTSTSSPTCRRRDRARSCAACSRPSPTRLDTGDITTLANPDIVEQIREASRGRTGGDEGGPGRPQAIRRAGVARSGSEP